MPAATTAAMLATDEQRARPDEQRTPPVPRAPSVPDLLRSAALGAATGARSSAGLTALACRSRPTDAGPAGSLARRSSLPLHLLTTAGEMGWDKHPSVPDRVSCQGMAPRVTLGAGAHRRFGSDLPGALAEDAVAATLAYLGAGGARPRP